MVEIDLENVVTWKMLVDKLHYSDCNSANSEQPAWLGWDGWVSVTSTDERHPENQAVKDNKASQ